MKISAPEIWIILGFICILLEFVLPGALIVFFGISALLVGLLIKFAFLPIENGIPLLVFAILSVGQIVFLRKRFQKMFKGQTVVDHGELADEFVGKQASVLEGFEDGSKYGTVVFKGTNWKAVAESSTLMIGDNVEILEQNGITLTVKKIEQ